jgi:hypothetical protein
MFLQHRASDLALVLSMCVALFDCKLNPQLYKSRKTGSKIRRRGAAFIDYVFKDSTDIEIIAFSSSCGKLGSANSASGRSVGLLRAGVLLCAIRMSVQMCLQRSRNQANLVASRFKVLEYYLGEPRRFNRVLGWMLLIVDDDRARSTLGEPSPLSPLGA